MARKRYSADEVIRQVNQKNDVKIQTLLILPDNASL